MQPVCWERPVMPATQTASDKQRPQKLNPPDQDLPRRTIRLERWLAEQQPACWVSRRKGIDLDKAIRVDWTTEAKGRPNSEMP